MVSTQSKATVGMRPGPQMQWVPILSLMFEDSRDNWGSRVVWTGGWATYCQCWKRKWRGQELSGSVRGIFHWPLTGIPWWRISSSRWSGCSRQPKDWEISGKLGGSWTVIPSPDGGRKYSPLRRGQKFIYWWCSWKGGKALTKGIGK